MKKGKKYSGVIVFHIPWRYINDDLLRLENDLQPEVAKLLLTLMVRGIMFNSISLMLILPLVE